MAPWYLMAAIQCNHNVSPACTGLRMAPRPMGTSRSPGNTGHQHRTHRNCRRGNKARDVPQRNSAPGSRLRLGL